MEESNKKQNTAFPVINQQSKYDSFGMSKRFYAACNAMQGLLSNAKIAEILYSYSIDNKKEIEYIIKASYKFADELLKQEND